MKFVEKLKGKLQKGKNGVQNDERGLTLIEMLIAILIFILSTVFIVSLVSNAIDKPKEAGVRSVLSSYESAGQLLMIETSGDLPGTTEAELIAELNKEVDPTAVFNTADGKTKIKNAYGNEYEVSINKDVTGKKASIVIETQGKKDDKYVLGIYYVEGEVHIGTDGFGRNNRTIDEDTLEKLGSGFTVGNKVTTTP